MAENVKGIVVEIGGDTKGLSKAISSLNSEIRGTQSELNKVNRLLKLDPTNIDLLKQKEQLLGEQIKNTENKVESLLNAKKKADQEMADGTEPCGTCTGFSGYRRNSRKVREHCKEVCTGIFGLCRSRSGSHKSGCRI